MLCRLSLALPEFYSDWKCMMGGSTHSGVLLLFQQLSAVTTFERALQSGSIPLQKHYVKLNSFS